MLLTRQRPLTFTVEDSPVGVYTSPNTVDVLTGEILPIAVDFARLLASGQTATVPTSSLTDLTTGAAVTLADQPTVSGTVLTQIVRGAALTAGHNYRLVVGVTAATTTVWQAAVNITCDF